MTQPGMPNTSQTPQPGYTTNPSQPGQGPSNNEWSKTLAEYLASSWAEGWRGLPGGWDEDKYGTPNKDDSNGVWSPQTILAFSRYAADYEPGKSSWIDQNMPYTPPQPDEYIEDPATTASRVAAENTDKNIAARMAELGYNYDALDETIKQNARQNALDKFSQELERYAIDAGLYKADQLNQIRQYETDAAIYQTLENVKAQNYATQAGMFNTGQTIQGQNIRQAGTLAGNLQNTYDARTQNAIDLRADPSDIVAREYATRALQGPEAEGIQGYRDVGELTEAIRKLIDWESQAQMPTEPTPDQAPQAPELGRGRPSAPSRPATQEPSLPDRPPGTPGSGKPLPDTATSQPPPGGGGGNQPPGGGGNNLNITPGIPNESLAPGRNRVKIPTGGSGIEHGRFDPNFDVFIVSPDGELTPLQPGQVAPPGADVVIDTPLGKGNEGIAGGEGSNVTDANTDLRKQYYDQDGVLRWTATQEPILHNGKKIVSPELAGSGDLPTGTPQTNQTASAQASSIQQQAQRSMVNPSEARRRWEARRDKAGSQVGKATGAVREAQGKGERATGTGSSSTGGKSLGTNLAGKQVSMTDKQKSLLDQYRKKTGRYAQGTKGTSRRKMIVGDPQADGRPNPELVEVSGKNVRTKVTPLANAMGKAQGAKMYAQGTNYGDDNKTFNADAPNIELPSYDNEAYQNLPSLRYLQGRGKRRGYGKLATGTAKGAFGTRAPEAGSINYGRYLDISRDPDSLGALQSIYKSANRNLAAEAARAKQRAPLGQAMRTSMIRT